MRFPFPSFHWLLIGVLLMVLPPCANAGNSYVSGGGRSYSKSSGAGVTSGSKNFNSSSGRSYSSGSSRSDDHPPSYNSGKSYSFGSDRRPSAGAQGPSSDSSFKRTLKSGATSKAPVFDSAAARAKKEQESRREFMAYQAIVQHDAALESRVRQLEAEQTPVEPIYTPPGLDRDLMYSDRQIQLAYSNRPTRAGRVSFWVLAIPTALGLSWFLGWLVFFKRWQVSSPTPSHS